jgi:hypothetical protein
MNLLLGFLSIVSINHSIGYFWHKKGISVTTPVRTEISTVFHFIGE